MTTVAENSVNTIAKRAMNQTTDFERDKVWKFYTKQENGETIVEREVKVRDLTLEELRNNLSVCRKFSGFKARSYWEFAITLELKYRSNIERLGMKNTECAKAMVLLESKVAESIA